MRHKNHIGIILKALLAGWVTIIFGTSTLLYFFASVGHKTYHQNLVLNTFRTIWEIGDAMGPVVKLSTILIFGLLVFAFIRKVDKNRTLLYWGSCIFALIAVLFVLAFLPKDLSRGYGIRLTGTRFEPAMTLLYLMGGLMGGIVFAYVYTKLSNNKQFA